MDAASRLGVCFCIFWGVHCPTPFMALRPGSTFWKFLMIRVLFALPISRALCKADWNGCFSGRSFRANDDIQCVAIHPILLLPISSPFCFCFCFIPPFPLSSVYLRLFYPHLLTPTKTPPNSEPAMVENFSHTVRNYVPSPNPIPTAAPAPPHISCPGSVVGSFMPSTLLSVSPSLPVHSTSYGGGGG